MVHHMQCNAASFPFIRCLLTIERAAGSGQRARRGAPRPRAAAVVCARPRPAHAATAPALHDARAPVYIRALRTGTDLHPTPVFTATITTAGRLAAAGALSAGGDRRGPAGLRAAAAAVRERARKKASGRRARIRRRRAPFTRSTPAGASPKPTPAPTNPPYP